MTEPHGIEKVREKRNPDSGFVKTVLQANGRRRAVWIYALDEMSGKWTI